MIYALIAVAQFASTTLAPTDTSPNVRSGVMMANALPQVAKSDAFNFHTDDGGRTYVAWYSNSDGVRIEVQVEFVGAIEHEGVTFISLRNVISGHWFHGPDGPNGVQGFWKSK